MGNVLETIAKRHSYRSAYQAAPVPREELEKIMQAGLAAPSGCNVQTTSLLAVDDPALLAALREQVKLPGHESAPAIICVLTQRIPSYRGNCYAVQDYSAAIENMLLAIAELGYASCWYEGQVNNEKQIGKKTAAFLGVPEEYELICILPVGVPAEEVKGPEKRSFNERAWFNRIG